jgi:hypothetical protein
LGCAWPVLIGLRTIDRLRQARGQELQQRVKISRRDVRGILARSILYYPFPRGWAKMAGLPRARA